LTAPSSKGVGTSLPPSYRSVVRTGPSTTRPSAQATAAYHPSPPK
jgi:hypothetical protein